MKRRSLVADCQTSWGQHSGEYWVLKPQGIDVMVEYKAFVLKVKTHGEDQGLECTLPDMERRWLAEKEGVVQGGGQG